MSFPPLNDLEAQFFRNRATQGPTGDPQYDYYLNATTAGSPNELTVVTDYAALRLVPGSNNLLVYVAGQSTGRSQIAGLFYWDPNATQADDGGVFISSPTTPGMWVRDRSQLGNVFSFGWYGAVKGTGKSSGQRTTNANSIQACIEAGLLNSGKVIDLDQGIYECASGIITFKWHTDVWKTELRFFDAGTGSSMDGSGPIHVKVVADVDYDLAPVSPTNAHTGAKVAGTYVEYAHMLLPDITQMSKPATVTVYGSDIGLQINNARDCVFFVGKITNCGWGLFMTARGHAYTYATDADPGTTLTGHIGSGNVDNTLWLTHFRNNGKNLVIMPRNIDAWTNENLFIGGHFYHAGTGQVRVAGTVHLYLGSGTNTVNNNVFLKANLEGVYVEYKIDCFGTDNRFIHCRYEANGGTGYVRFISGSSPYSDGANNVALRNVLDGGATLSSVVITEEALAPYATPAKYNVMNTPTANSYTTNTTSRGIFNLASIADVDLNTNPTSPAYAPLIRFLKFGTVMEDTGGANINKWQMILSYGYIFGKAESQAVDSFRIRMATGIISWGDGTTTAHHTNLKSGGVGLLQTDNQFYAAKGMRLLTKAGTPTDADISPVADGVLIYDTSAHKLWIREGGTWKSGVAFT